MRTTLQVKKGSTFIRLCSYSSGGVPVNLTGSTIRSSVRDKSGTLVEELTVVLGDQGVAPGTFTLNATALQTSTWNTGILDADFRIEDSLGSVVHSTTFLLAVEPSITV